LGLGTPPLKKREIKIVSFCCRIWWLPVMLLLTPLLEKGSRHLNNQWYFLYKNICFLQGINIRFYRYPELSLWLVFNICKCRKGKYLDTKFVSCNVFIKTEEIDPTLFRCHRYILIFMLRTCFLQYVCTLVQEF